VENNKHMKGWLHQEHLQVRSAIFNNFPLVCKRQLCKACFFLGIFCFTFEEIPKLNLMLTAVHSLYSSLTCNPPSPLFPCDFFPSSAALYIYKYLLPAISFLSKPFIFFINFSPNHFFLFVKLSPFSMLIHFR
jgi:hypothetical protein